MKQSKCFAPGCNSGYNTSKEKVSIFKAPNDEVELAKWQAIIPRIDRKLTPSDVLCERHFDKSDIKRHLEINNVLVPFQRPRLKKGAVPKYFPLSPSYLYPCRKRDRRVQKQYGLQQVEKHVPVILKKTVLPVVTDNEVNKIDVPLATVQNDTLVKKGEVHHVTEDKGTIQEKNEDVFTDLHSQPLYLYPFRKRDRRFVKQYGSQQAEKYVPVILKKIVPVVVTDNEVVNETDAPITTVQDDTSLKKVEVHHVTEVKETIQENNEDLFMDLHSQKESLTLDTYWAVFPCSDSFKKYILLSQMSVKNDIPTMERQIIVSESLELKYYFGKKELKDVQQLPACAKCKSDIEQAAKYFSELYFCYGGPPSHMYSEVIGITECAYIDSISATWRHKNCPLFTNPLNSKQCAFCVSLYTRFKKNLQTANHPRKRKRRKLMGTIMTNNEVLAQRNRIDRYKLVRSETRIKMQLEKLQNRVKELENDFKELSEMSVEDKLRGMNVPEEQVLVITECINAAKCTDKSARRYSHKWIMTCLLLYAESQDAYRYMHANNILPLCDIETITKYSNSKCGLLETLSDIVSESDET